jgi:uncharacterized UPF0146 family protein
MARSRLAAVRVTYALWYEAWTGFDSFLANLILRENARSVCEIGGGSNPALSLDFVRENNLDYLVVDISAEELAKAPPGYATLEVDVTSPSFHLPATYDLIFSRTVAEHVRRPADFHRNIFKFLAPNGVAFHFFPTLYTLPYLFNRVMPARITHRLLKAIGGTHDKFRAYYRWCRGPQRSQIRKLEKIGYRLEEYVGFFGHGYYSRFRRLQALNDWLASFFVRHPEPLLTSYVYVVLRRPPTPV